MAYNKEIEVLAQDVSPPLDDLISEIDRQIEKMPHPYAGEGFEAFLGSQLGAIKKRGRQYITFQLETTEFALPLKNAFEISYCPDITPLPNLPQWALGICNIRGDIVSVVDLKHILQLTTSSSANPGAYLIILHDEDVTAAIRIDKITGIFFDGDQDRKLEKSLSKQKRFLHYVRSIFVSGQRYVHLLDMKILMPAIRIDSPNVA